MENISDLNIRISPSTSALAISWNDLAAMGYKLTCNSVTGYSVDNFSHSIQLSLQNSMTTIVLDKLLSGVSYNCCVSTVGLPASATNDTAVDSDCMVSMALDELSAHDWRDHRNCGHSSGHINHSRNYSSPKAQVIDNFRGGKNCGGLEKLIHNIPFVKPW